MKESEHFIFGESHPKEDAGGGITRQIMGYNNELMLVKNWFEEGAIGYVHEHIHSQVAYVESGEFDVQVYDQIKTLKAGDCFYVPPNGKHGAVCKKAGVLLDMFSPHREDFLE